MNSQIEAFARTELKHGLAKCTEAQQIMFKRMYPHGDLDKGINQVVDDMPAEKLDWALTQVQNTLCKRGSEGSPEASASK